MAQRGASPRCSTPLPSARRSRDGAGDSSLWTEAERKALVAIRNAGQAIANLAEDGLRDR